MARRQAIGRTVSGLVTVLGLTITVMAIPVETSRAGAEAWVRALSETERLQCSRAERIRKLPSEYRGALSRGLSSAENRAEFWRNVFTAFRHGRQLSQAQEAALGSAESLIDSALSGAAERTAIVTRLTDARARVVATLGQQAANELFLGVAPVNVGSDGLPIGERLRYLWRTHRPFVLVKAVNYVLPPVLATTCNCSTETSCSGHAECGVPHLCEPYEPSTCPGFGCGDWGCYGCWMVCYYPN